MNLKISPNRSTSAENVLSGSQSGRTSGVGMWVVLIILLLVGGGLVFGLKQAYDARLAAVEQETARQVAELKQQLAATKQASLMQGDGANNSYNQNDTNEAADSSAESSKSPPGTAATQGPPGVAGTQGATGASGSDGPQGPAGAPGQDAQDGSDGQNGSDGATGPQGPEGPPGPSGVASCPNGPCLSAQSTSPGTQEAGSINIAGKALIGDGIETTTADFSGQVSAVSFAQNGNSVCDNSNNCGYATSGQLANTFVQNGNSFGGIATLGTDDNQPLVFETNGLETVRLLPNGNVGIGTSSPGSLLDVNGTTTSTAVLTPQLDALAPVLGAISRTPLISHTSGSLGSSTNPYLAPDQFTPSANQVIVAYVHAGEDCSANYPLDATNLTISGGSLSWIPIGGASASGGCGVAQRAFYAVIDGSPPQNMEVTLDAGSFAARDFSILIDEYANLDTSNPVAGANFGNRLSSANDTFTINTSTSPATGDWKVGTATIQGGAAPFNYDVVSGWTQAYGLLNFIQESQGVYQTGGTSPTVNFKVGSNIDGFGSTAYGGFILKQATSANSPLTIGGTNATGITIGNSNTDITLPNITFTASGNVGIGTANPGAALHVNNTDTGTVAALIRGASGQTANIFEVFNSSSQGIMVDAAGALTANWGVSITGGLTLGDTSHFIGNSDTRGQVTVAAAATSATYTFTSAYDSAPNVVVTPTSNPGSHYWVSNVTTTGFTVNLASAPGSDVTFNFQAQQ